MPRAGPRTVRLVEPHDHRTAGVLGEFDHLDNDRRVVDARERLNRAEHRAPHTAHRTQRTARSGKFWREPSASASTMPAPTRIATRNSCALWSALRSG